MYRIMEFLYATLSLYGNTHYQDIERNEDGVANITDVNIVFDFGNGYQPSDNIVVTDMELMVDIWSKREQIYESEKVVSMIDEALVGLYKSLCDDGQINISRGNPFRINMGDLDKNINRVRLQYDIKIYK